jgi:hypothetical protein
VRDVLDCAEHRACRRRHPLQHITISTFLTHTQTDAPGVYARTRAAAPPARPPGAARPPTAARSARGAYPTSALAARLAACRDAGARPAGRATARARSSWSPRGSGAQRAASAERRRTSRANERGTVGARSMKVATRARWAPASASRTARVPPPPPAAVDHHQHPPLAHTDALTWRLCT